VAGADELVIGDGVGSYGLTIFTGAAQIGRISFCDTGGASSQSALFYNHSQNALFVQANSSTVALFNSTGFHPNTNNSVDLGDAANSRRWRTGYFGTSVVSPLVNGADFGTGSGAGTATTVRGGSGGTTGGNGAALNLTGGSALTGAGAGAAVNITSGNSDGATDAPNVNVTSGTSGSGKLGLLSITNTALELAEIDSTNLPTIGAAKGRLSARNDDGFTQPIWTSDDDAKHEILLSGYVSYFGISAQSLGRVASTNAIAAGFGVPTADAEILAADWVDVMSSNAGTPPTINGKSYVAVPGEAAAISLELAIFDLNTSACTATDSWIYVARIRGHGYVILFRVDIT
jgi:hypothetical protein